MRRGVQAITPPGRGRLSRESRRSQLATFTCAGQIPAMIFRDHAQILLDAGGTRHVAALFGLSPGTVGNWRTRNQIPAGYWLDFVERDWADLLELAMWAQASRLIWRGR
jgi:hypothetical protein